MPPRQHPQPQHPPTLWLPPGRHRTRQVTAHRMHFTDLAIFKIQNFGLVIPELIFGLAIPKVMLIERVRKTDIK